MTDPKKPTWTIMVYISADEVLANFAVESLKQLRRAVGDGVTVVAQFDTNARRDVRLLNFTEPHHVDASLDENKIKDVKLDPDLNMADPKTLTTFIDYATENYQADHYCLITWSHGPELLLDEGPSSRPTDPSVRKYLTPANLRKALEATKLVTGDLAQESPGQKIAPGQQAEASKKKRKLDVIAIDACSMSMIEVASELQGCVQFMIASQDDVPDASFPYEQILTQLKKHDRDDLRGICASVPHLYKKAFQDYSPTPGPGTDEITLSCLNLSATGEIAGPLKLLADALLLSASDHGLRKTIIDARAGTRSYVQGIFVDLFDFCQQLTQQLATAKITNEPLQVACYEVQKAISARGGDAFVVENQSGKNGETRSHGVSIYLPYFSEVEDRQAQEFLGNTTPTDVVTHLSLLVKGGKDSLHKARAERIEELEADLRQLHQFGQTEWNKFIEQGWSFILATELRDKLGEHYAAQQCALNLLSLCRLPGSESGKSGPSQVTVMPTPADQRKTG